MMRIKLGIGFAAAAWAGNAAADVQQGVRAWRAGDYATAIYEWTGPAEAGDPDAQFNLGQAYKLGRGVPQDLERSAELFRLAAEQGHLQAQTNFGLFLWVQGNRREALAWLRAAANRGEPYAQYVYGLALFEGEQVERDLERAYAMMTRAAANDVPGAAASLERFDQLFSADQREAGRRIAQSLEEQGEEIALAVVPPPAPARRPPAAARPAPAPVEETPVDPPPSPAETSPAPAAPVEDDSGEEPVEAGAEPTGPAPDPQISPIETNPTDNPAETADAAEENAPASTAEAAPAEPTESNQSAIENDEPLDDPPPLPEQPTPEPAISEPAMIDELPPAETESADEAPSADSASPETPPETESETVAPPPENMPVSADEPAEAPADEIASAEMQSEDMPIASEEPAEELPLPGEPPDRLPDPDAPETAPPAATGDWRIQLGAFRERSSAEAHWHNLSSSVAELTGLRPFIDALGSLYRLRAGPFANQAEAGRACAAARDAGSECIVARER